MDEDEILINGVRERPFLYVASRPDYRDLPKRENAFITIGKALNMTGDETAKRWKCLRDRFARERRTIQDRIRGGASADTTSKWKYYDSLTFLIDHLRIRSTSSNMHENTDNNARHDTWEGDIPLDAEVINSPEAQDMVTSIVTVLDEDVTGLENRNDGCATPSTASPKDLGQPPPKYRRLDGSAELASAMRSVGTAIFSRSLPPTQNMDAEDAFGCNVAMRLKRLSQQKSSLAQMRIQQILYEIEFDDQPM